MKELGDEAHAFSGSGKKRQKRKPVTGIELANDSRPETLDYARTIIAVGRTCPYKIEPVRHRREAFVVIWLCIFAKYIY